MTDDSYKELLKAGYEAMGEKLACVEALRIAGDVALTAARKFHRAARLMFWFNFAWALLNLFVTLRHVHGARTDQAGIHAGPDTSVGRGAVPERRSDARVYPPRLTLVDR